MTKVHFNPNALLQISLRSVLINRLTPNDPYMDRTVP